MVVPIIYFDSSVIYLGTEHQDKIAQKSLVVKNAEMLHLHMDHFLQDKTSSSIHFSGYKTSLLFEDFISYFKFIEAAGGLVQNTDEKYLFIKRFGIWDLPKGKLYKNEAPEKGAMREVEEETGIGQLSILGTLQDTYHIYFYKNEWVLKKTYWYRMTTQSKTKPIPQEEEKIMEAVWLNKIQSVDALAKSYRSLNDNFTPLP